jgi:alkaline phosphatase
VGNHPTIEDSTTAAIDVLSADPDGFFLMVEAGQSALA